MSVFLPIPKKDNAKECSNYCTIVLISHVSKAILKILQQYVNRKRPDVQLDLEKAEEPEINYQYPLHHRKSKGIPEKNLLLLHDYLKAFDSVDHKKLWKILKEMGVPDHLICLLRKLYAS